MRLPGAAGGGGEEAGETSRDEALARAVFARAPVTFPGSPKLSAYSLSPRERFIRMEMLYRARGMLWKSIAA